MSCQSFTWVSNRNTHSQQEKNNNCIFLFSSFHQLQKAGTNKTYFSVKSRQTKLRAFTVDRKTDHTIPIFTWASTFYSNNVRRRPRIHFPSLQARRRSVSKTLFNWWQVCVQPSKSTAVLWLREQHFWQKDAGRVCSPAPSLTLIRAWTVTLSESLLLKCPSEVHTAINRIMAH